MAQLWHHFGTIASFLAQFGIHTAQTWCHRSAKSGAAAPLATNLAPGPACGWSLPGAVYTEQYEWPVRLSRGDEDGAAAGNPAADQGSGPGRGRVPDHR